MIIFIFWFCAFYIKRTSKDPTVGHIYLKVEILKYERHYKPIVILGCKPLTCCLSISVHPLLDQLAKLPVYMNINFTLTILTIAYLTLCQQSLFINGTVVL